MHRVAVSFMTDRGLYHTFITLDPTRGVRYHRRILANACRVCD